MKDKKHKKYIYIYIYIYIYYQVFDIKMMHILFYLKLNIKKDIRIV